MARKAEIIEIGIPVDDRDVVAASYAAGVGTTVAKLRVEHKTKYDFT